MKCEICGSGTGSLEVNHIDKGKIMVCRDCWKDLYSENETVAGTSNESNNTSPCSGSSCMSCGV